jgi:hypothetical protein
VPRSTWQKPVCFSVEFGANYLWHLLAVARVGYQSEYASQFRSSVGTGDLELIASCKKDLAWAEDTGGALAGFFVNLPAWLNLESRSEFEAYFETLQTALVEGSLQPFVRRFPDRAWHNPYYRYYLRQADFAPELSGHLETARLLAGAYLRNLDAYRRQVWPRIVQRLGPRKRALAVEFERTDYIARWESLVGVPFAMPRYEFILCGANQGGPDYNSVGYGRTVFYYDKPFLRTCQFLSHEIGTHLLFEVYAEVLEDDRCDRRKAYCALETLAMFYNKLILGVDSLQYHLPGMEEDAHLQRYAAAYRAGTHPRELFRTAL